MDGTKAMDEKQLQDNRIKRYLKPAALVMVLVALLVMGGLYLRSFFSEQTAQERSAQLREMSSQIRVNLDYNLETHWNLVASLKDSISSHSFSSAAEVQQAIYQLEKNFHTDLYGCRVLLLDDMGRGYTSVGDVGIWNDIKFLADGAIKHTFVSDTSNVKGTFLAFTHKLEG